MNSEVPSNPESGREKDLRSASQSNSVRDIDNPKTEHADSVDLPLEELLEVESTSDIDDAWSVEDIIDLGVQPEIESQQSEIESVNFTIEPDSSEINEVAESTTIETYSTQDTEIVDSPTVKTTTVDSPNESELFVDSWLDEPKSDVLPTSDSEDSVQQEEIASLEEQKATLNSEIEALKTQKEQMILQQRPKKFRQPWLELSKKERGN